MYVGVGVWTRTMYVSTYILVGVKPPEEAGSLNTHLHNAHSTTPYSVHSHHVCTGMALTPGRELPLHLNVKVWTRFQFLQQQGHVPVAILAQLLLTFLHHHAHNLWVSTTHGLIQCCREEDRSTAHGYNLCTCWTTRTQTFSGQNPLMYHVLLEHWIMSKVCGAWMRTVDRNREAWTTLVVCGTQ